MIEDEDEDEDEIDSNSDEMRKAKLFFSQALDWERERLCMTGQLANSLRSGNTTIRYSIESES